MSGARASKPWAMPSSACWSRPTAYRKASICKASSTRSIHYDLSWNPTRHQQREGRVDRFGQPAKLVRSVLLYSPDSAIDGAVLEVILRKAEQIRKATGVTVPLPDERGAVTGALMNAVLLRKGRSQQLSLDFGLAADAAAMETRWRDAEEGERRSRARFAQNAIKPEEVDPRVAALARPARQPGSGPPLRGTRNEPPRCAAGAGEIGTVARPSCDALPAVAVANGSRRVASKAPCASLSRSRRRRVPRSSRAAIRLPATLAETLLEGALDPGSSPVPSLGRAGAWPTPAVKTVTTVALLRLRYKLTVRGRNERMLLAEEAAALAWDASHRPDRSRRQRPRAHCSNNRRRPISLRSRGSGDREGDRADAGAARRSDRRLCARAGTGAWPRIMPAFAPPLRAAPASASSRCCPPTSSASTCSCRRDTERWPRARTDRTAALAFDAITVEGALIAPAMLARIAQHQAGGPDRSGLRHP